MISVADIVIIALIVLMGLFGFSKGFKKSLISFFGFVVSILLVVIFSKTVASALLSLKGIGNMVAGKSSLFSFVKGLLPKGLSSISASDISGAAAGGDAAIQALFKGKGLSSVFMNLCYPMVKSSLTNPVYLNSGMAAADMVAMELAFGIYCFIVGVAMFIVIRIVIAAISLIFKSRIGAKKRLGGRLLGLCIGMAKGFLYTMVILCLVSFMTGFSFMKPINEKLDDSVIAKPLTSVSTSLMSRILHKYPDDPRYAELVKIAGFELDESLPIPETETETETETEIETEPETEIETETEE